MTINFSKKFDDFIHFKCYTIPEKCPRTTQLRKLLKWHRLAAAQSDSIAQEKLGLLYVLGQGVPQDYAETLKWFSRSAAQGSAYAQWNLGAMYKEGEGVPQDYAEALKWYRLAAAQGNANEQWSLGDMHYEGLGVPQDYVQAHKWLYLAAPTLKNESHRNKAVKERDYVAARMTPAQIADAQKLAREWKKQ